MATDAKELFLDHGEKLLLGTSVLALIFTLVSGGDSGVGETLQEIDKMKKDIASARSKKAPDVGSVGNMAARVAKRWEKVQGGDLNASWAFFTVKPFDPDKVFEIEVPPEKQVVIAASDLSVTADEKGKFLDVAWSAPSSETEIDGKVKKVSDTYGFVIYRWSGKADGTAKGGVQDSNLLRVLLGEETQYRDEDVRANEVYHYAVSVLTQALEAQGGGLWKCSMGTFIDQDVARIPTDWEEEKRQEARQTTSLRRSDPTDTGSAKVPDNVELIFVSYTNGMATIEVTKRFKGDVKVKKSFYLREKDRIGKKNVRIRVPGSEKRNWDMTTKYTLVKVESFRVPFMSGATETKYSVGGGKKQVWAAKSLREIQKEHPDAEMVLDDQGKVVQRRVQVAVVGQDGKPKMIDSYKVVVRDGEGNQYTHPMLDK